jgi:hypothetical protein
VVNHPLASLLIKQQLLVDPSRGTQDEGDAGEEAARKALADSRQKNEPNVIKQQILA